MTAFALLSLLVLSSVSWIGTDADVYTLKVDSKPLSYRLHFEPNMTGSNFTGSAIIDFTMIISTSLLKMNQKGLKIDTLEIEGVPITKWIVDENSEMLVVYCAAMLNANNDYRIKIEYKGVLSQLSRGFYRTSYTIDDETRWIAATQFEPTFAREAFPCWDEPIYKAVFDISIRHLCNYTTVISNMPIVQKTHHPDFTITTYFNRSMPMSTYLVAFIVSDFAFKSYDDLRFQIFTRTNAIDATELAYNFSLEAMKVMDEYTEIPYFKINPKMDQATMPYSDRDVMHNWGLIHYREDFLLYEEGVSTIMDKEKIITTISHAFSHQWFGNLVSPQWWDSIWLNEGFATYFQYFIAHKVMPTWRIKDLFPVKSMQFGAFLFEGTNDTRAMNKPATKPNEIRRLFDEVADDKAACVIRMFSHILTEEVFHTAMKNYLRENSYGVADSDNLIGHLQDAAGQDKTWGGVSLAEIARNWITTSGYPIVIVKKTSSRHYTLTHKQFVFSNKTVEDGWYIPGDYEKKWWIPITYATNRNLNFADTSVTHWINPNVTSITIFEPDTDWILLNKQQTGYYRVTYDVEIWQNITKYLKSSNMHRIHPVNRAQLIDDAITLARIDYITFDTALDLTLYLYREIDYIPWMTAFSNLEILIRDIIPSKHYHIYKHYIRYIMHSLTKNVTYASSPKDDLPTKFIKVEAMKVACLAGVQECLDEAHKEFYRWLKDRKYRLDIDMKRTILCTGLRNATEAVWDEARKKLSNEILNEGGDAGTLTVLGCSSNRTILQKFLLSTARPDRILRFETAVRAVVSNTYVDGLKIIQHILDRENDTLKHMPNFDSERKGVAYYTSNHLKNSDDLGWLIKYLDEVKPSEESMEIVISTALSTINRVQRFGPMLDKWLLKNEKLFNSSGSEKTFMSLLLIFSIFNTTLFKIFF